MNQPLDIPREVLAAYGLESGRVQPIHSLINRTFRVEHPVGAAIVQRLHPVFGAEVHLDIDAITQHLQGAGMLTPRLLRTREGALWLEHAGEVWRAMTFLDGMTYDRIHQPAFAHAAGAAVARFHRALAAMKHTFHFVRAGVHDTAAHLSGLRAALASEAARSMPEAAALGKALLTVGQALPLDQIAGLPARVGHGDLKISNLLFAADGTAQVVCLIDLDTLGTQRMAYELGDALRSWCNPHTEDAAAPALDAALFDAALAGYAEGAPAFLTESEVATIVSGTHAVCVELATRFCRDAIEDRYFGWDASRYPSRRAHNLARARSQLALARAIADRRSELEQIARVRLG